MYMHHYICVMLHHMDTREPVIWPLYNIIIIMRNFQFYCLKVRTYIEPSLILYSACAISSTLSAAADIGVAIFSD